MATYNGTLLSAIATIYVQEQTEIEAEIPVYSGDVREPTYYKCRATSDVDPSGYITWINTTGDETNRPSPGGTIGATQIVGKWTQ